MERDRFVIGDTVWEKIAALLPGKKSDRGVTAKDNRLFLEAVLWRVRAGVPWRDLPSGFGNGNTVFKRFRRWVRATVFDRIFVVLSGEADFEYAMVDGTIVTAHQKASGAKGRYYVAPATTANWRRSADFTTFMAWKTSTSWLA